MNKIKESLKKLKDTIKTNFINNKVVFLVVSIVWIALIVGSLVYYYPTLGKESKGNDTGSYIVEIDENTTVKEIMPVNEDIESISIKFATYARKNDGKFHVLIKGQTTGTEYINQYFDVNKINDNSFFTLDVKGDIGPKDKNVIVELSSTSASGKGVGVYFSNEKCFDGSFLTINGEEQTGDLTLRYLVENEYLWSYYVGVITWTIVGISLIIFLIILVKPKYEILFPIIVLILGLIFMSIIIPLSPPDEQAHYEYSLQYSNLLLGNKNFLEINKAYLYYGYFYGHYNVSGGYIRFIEDFAKPLELSSKTVLIDQSIESVSFLGYIPQTLGITIARLLGLNMLKTFYTGRLFNLLFYCACLYIAIKVTPIHKFLFGMIYSLPIFVQTAMSLSYDNFVICLSLLVFAYFMKWYFGEDKIKIPEYIFVLLVCIGLSQVKYLYGFLSFAFMFVPKARFKNVWVKWGLVILLIIGGSNSMMPIIYDKIKDNMSVITSTEDAPTMEDLIPEIKEDIPEDNTENENEKVDYVVEEDVQQTETDVVETDVVENDVEVSDDVTPQTNIVDTEESMVDDENWNGEGRYPSWYIFAHPGEIAVIFLRTIRYYIKMWFYSAIGRNLSGGTLILPLSMVHIIVAIVGVSCFRKEEYVPPIWLKGLYVLACVGIGLLIMMSMFLTWTTYNQTIVDAFGGIVVQGVQGRYFCPILVYFLAIFNNKKIAIPEKFDKYILLTYIFMFFEIIVYVLSYTFVN